MAQIYIQLIVRPRLPEGGHFHLFLLCDNESNSILIIGRVQCSLSWQLFLDNHDFPRLCQHGQGRPLAWSSGAKGFIVVFMILAILFYNVIKCEYDQKEVNNLTSHLPETAWFTLANDNIKAQWPVRFFYVKIYIWQSSQWSDTCVLIEEKEELRLRVLAALSFISFDHHRCVHSAHWVGTA